MQATASDLSAARDRLKRVPPAVQVKNQKHAESRDLSQADEQKITEEFFRAGVENWLPFLGDFTFESASISLHRSLCEAIVSSSVSDEAKNATAKKIDATMEKLCWDQIFVKLSTRSPKDSPLILSKAAKNFGDRGGHELPSFLERARVLAQAVQESFSVRCGGEAVELLLSSERVKEDIEYSLQAENFENLGLNIVMRKWEGPIPIENEFRGIVWDGSMNSLGQYYHPFVFPSMIQNKRQIEDDIRSVQKELQPLLSKNGFENYVIDFAWLAPGKVKVIELNPFDGIALGCFPCSTGLFLWDDESDRKIITSGPFEFRMRATPLPEHVLKNRLNCSWKDIIN